MATINLHMVFIKKDCQVFFRTRDENVGLTRSGHLSFKNYFNKTKRDNYKVNVFLQKLLVNIYLIKIVFVNLNIKNTYVLCTSILIRDDSSTIFLMKTNIVFTIIITLYLCHLTLKTIRF